MDMETAIYIDSKRGGGKARQKRWSKREYQQHIFQLGRGKPGRVDDAGDVAATNWWNANQDSLSHMYEQEEIDINDAKNAKGEAYQQFWGSDKVDRARYRADKQAALKQQFRANLGLHPAFKDKTNKELTDIADAYLKGDDFGGADQKEIAAALKEVADYTTGDGEVAMSDERTWRKTYPRKNKKEPASASDTQSTGSRENTAVPVLQNGRNIVGTETPAGGQSTVTLIPPANTSIKPDLSTNVKNIESPATTSEFSVGNTPVEINNTGAMNNVREAQAIKAKTAATQADRELKQVQTDARSDARRNEQAYMATQDALNANLRERWERQNAELNKRKAARMNKRYESRTLTGMSDWENLGRDSVKRNFGARAEGESDEDWNARSGAVDAVENLRERFATLGIRDADKNEFYAHNPNRMRDVAGLSNLFNKAVENGSLTDAQIEGLNKTLDGYEKEGRVKANKIKKFNAMRDAENVAKYRTMYGMTDTNVFSADDVKAFHESQKKAAFKNILKNMQVAPGQGGEEGRSQRISDFSDNWVKLIDSGFDVDATFRKAMSDQDNNRAFKKSIASIAMDDPERNDKVDQIRRRFVMNQAMQDAGLEDKVLGSRIDATGMTEAQIDEASAAAQADVMTQGLPGKRGLPNISDTILPKPPPALQQPAAPATSITPGQKEEEETRQAAKGGMVIRPKRRVS